jgi:hypothetical protein
VEPEESQEVEKKVKIAHIHTDFAHLLGRMIRCADRYYKSSTVLTTWPDQLL